MYKIFSLSTTIIFILSFSIGSFSVAPVFAKTGSTALMRQSAQSRTICLRAVRARQSATTNDNRVMRDTSIQGALTIRTQAVNAAKNLATAKARRVAIRSAWATYRAAVKAAHNNYKMIQLNARVQKNADSNNCPPAHTSRKR